jgi:hypothetical protein
VPEWSKHQIFAAGKALAGERGDAVVRSPGGGEGESAHPVGVVPRGGAAGALRDRLAGRPVAPTAAWRWRGGRFGRGCAERAGRLLRRRSGRDARLPFGGG